MDNQQPSYNSRPKAGYGFIYLYRSPSNKVYIGQTVQSLRERAKSTVSGKGYKKCSVFWKAIQKYGFKNFEVEILEEVKVSELNEKEEYYIEKYNSLAPNGYNLTNGGEGGKRKEVFLYSAQNGRFLEHFCSLSESSVFTNVPIETISMVMNSKNRKTTHNYIFSEKYLGEQIEVNSAKENYHKVYVYNENGTFVSQYNSISDASKKLHIGYSSICRNIDKNKLSCGFYFFSQEKENIIPSKMRKLGKMVCQIDPNDFSIVKIYRSQREACDAIGISSTSSLSRAISRNGKCKGFYWRVVEGSTTKDSENPTEAVQGTQQGEDIV